MDSKQKKALIILGIIIIAGFLLRVYKLDSQSLWLDEAFSIHYSQQGLMSVITMQDPTPPLYYSLLHFWIGPTGISVFATRFLSVVFGTVSIFLVYLLAKSMFDEKVGLLSALLLALSPLHINYSQEARAYALFFALILLSMYFYYRLSKGNLTKGRAASKGTIMGYLLSTLLLLYSHFYAIFIILAQGLHLAFTSKLKLSKGFKLSKKIKLWLMLQAVMLIFYTPWLAHVLFMPSNAYSWIPRPSLLQIIYMIYSFFSGMAFSFYGLALTMICLALILVYARKSRMDEKSSLLWLWVAVPIIIPFLFSLVFTPIFVPKYVYFASLPLYIMVSKAVFSINKRRKVAIIALIAFLSLASLWVQQNDIMRDPWDRVAGYVSESYNEGDNVAIINSYQILPFAYYYENECFRSDDIFGCSQAKGIYPVDNLDQIKAAGKGDFWLIVSRDIYDDETIRVLDYFNENYNLADSREYLLNQDSAFFNSLYQYFDQKKLIQLRLNRIRVLYFQEKS